MIIINVEWVAILHALQPNLLLQPNKATNVEFLISSWYCSCSKQVL